MTVVRTAIEFYSHLYSTQEMGAAKRKEYTDRIINDFFSFVKEKQYHKIPRALQILILIIDESEKGGPAPLKALATFKKGEQLTFDVVNENAYLGDSNKSFQIKIDSNNTLFELRKHIAKSMTLTWQEVKMSQKEEISDLFNGRLIKDTPLKLNESLKVNKRFTSQLQEDLIVNNRLSPKAIKAFQNVFSRFSTKGKMSREECHNFTIVCLGEAASRTYDERISSLYEKYDDDKDNFLTFQNFLAFYEDAAKERPSTVWNNLKSCRIRYDFKPMDDPESDVLDVNALPRYELSLNDSFYEALFCLLSEDEEVAKSSWMMLEKMPVSRNMYE